VIKEGKKARGQEDRERKDGQKPEAGKRKKAREEVGINATREKEERNGEEE